MDVPPYFLKSNLSHTRNLEYHSTSHSVFSCSGGGPAFPLQGKDKCDKTEELL